MQVNLGEPREYGQPPPQSLVNSKIRAIDRQPSYLKVMNCGGNDVARCCAVDGPEVTSYQ